MANKKKKQKKMTIGDVGFAMKMEAHRTPGDNILVSKQLWLEIADLLMFTHRNLKEIERTLKGGAGDGK